MLEILFMHVLIAIRLSFNAYAGNSSLYMFWLLSCWVLINVSLCLMFRMVEWMPCILLHLFTPMPKMPQTSCGHWKPMTTSREDIPLFIIFFNAASDLLINHLYTFLMISHRYADGANAYWTGFFTSRPALKRYVRILSGYYLVCYFYSIQNEIKWLFLVCTQAF